MNKSTKFKVDGQYSKCMIPSRTFSLIKYFWISTCLVLWWKIGFLAKEIADWLFEEIKDGSDCPYPISFKRCLNQIASWAATNMTRYLISMVEKDTIGCFLEAQKIAPKPMLNTYEKVDFLSSLSLS